MFWTYRENFTSSMSFTITYCNVKDIEEEQGGDIRIHSEDMKLCSLLKKDTLVSIVYAQKIQQFI